jgi:hypothetical protein
LIPFSDPCTTKPLMVMSLFCRLMEKLPAPVTIESSVGSAAVTVVHLLMFTLVAPTSVSDGLFTTTLSLYWSGQTLMVSPGKAALTAAWIDVKPAFGHCILSLSTTID